MANADDVVRRVLGFSDTYETFPPLTVGTRVWSGLGAGTIEGIENPYHLDGNDLYVVRWDDGERTKGYARHVRSIGRFDSPAAFNAATRITGRIVRWVGPKGGFKFYEAKLTHDGREFQARIYDREMAEWVREIADASGAEIVDLPL